MKLRILDNYIRLRLSQTEVDEFGSTGEVSSKITIAGNALIYRIKISNTLDVKTTFENNTISVLVPKKISERWLLPEEVGFKNKDQSNLKILVEKDFECLHKRPEEDESDNFPNPLASQK